MQKGTVPVSQIICVETELFWDDTNINSASNCNLGYQITEKKYDNDDSSKKSFTEEIKKSNKSINKFSAKSSDPTDPSPRRKKSSLEDLHICFRQKGFFVIYNNYKDGNWKNRFIIKGVLPHFLGTFFITLIIYMQTELDTSCFIPEICNCGSEDYLKKFLFYFRQIFVQWVFIVVSYSNIFGLSARNEFKLARGIHLILNFLAILILLMTFDGNKAFPGQTKNIILWTIFILFLVAKFYFMEKFNCSLFKLHNTLTTLLSLFLFIMYIFTTYALNPLRSRIYVKFSTQIADLLYTLLISVSIQMIQKGFEISMSKFEKNLIEGSFNSNAFGIFSKYFLIISYGLRLSNINKIETVSFPYVFSLATFASFIVNYHSGWNPILYSYQRFSHFIKKKKGKFSFTTSQTLFQRQILSFQRLEVLVVYITRSTCFMINRKFFDYHVADMNIITDCFLRAKQHILSNNFNVTSIFVVDLCITAVMLIKDYKNGFVQFKFLTEETTYIFRVMNIISLQILLEIYISVDQ